MFRISTASERTFSNLKIGDKVIVRLAETECDTGVIGTVQKVTWSGCVFVNGRKFNRDGYEAGLHSFMRLSEATEENLAKLNSGYQ